MTTEKPEQTERRWMPFGVWALLLLVVYVLSIGPAYALILRFPGPWTTTAYAIVYTPFVWLCPEDGIAMEWLNWWAELWVRLIYAPP